MRSYLNLQLKMNFFEASLLCMEDQISLVEICHRICVRWLNALIYCLYLLCEVGDWCDVIAAKSIRRFRKSKPVDGFKNGELSARFEDPMKLVECLLLGRDINQHGARRHHINRFITDHGEI